MKFCEQNTLLKCSRDHLVLRLMCFIPNCVRIYFRTFNIQGKLKQDDEDNKYTQIYYVLKPTRVPVLKVIILKKVMKRYFCSEYSTKTNFTKYEMILLVNFSFFAVWKIEMFSFFCFIFFAVQYWYRRRYVRYLVS